MRMATIVSLGASAALGLAALIVAKTMAPHPTAASAATPKIQVQPGVPVVVAAGPIAYGAKLEAKDLVVANLPAAAVPEGAYPTVAAILGQEGGAPVALSAMTAHEPVLASHLSGPGVRATIAATIAPGMRAYTIGVNDVAGGGGHVLPGDRVDVLLARTITGGSEDQGKRMRSDVVIQNVRVLGMDLDANPADDKPFTAKTATLEVSMEDAQKLALSSESGTLSLALRRPGSAEISPTRTMQVSDIGGGAPAPRGPALAGGPTHAIRARRPVAVIVAPAGSSVLVMSGDKAERVTVPTEGRR
ncbi:MAG: Flp pilus assembly protein CpaB [Caulobacter sp.]|nr:Flp pilus assembly protein CpaB [Caulobacter sp.]